MYTYELGGHGQLSGAAIAFSVVDIPLCVLL